MVPGEIFRPLLEAWLAEFETLDDAANWLAGESSGAAWARRLYNWRTDGRPSFRLEHVDEFLTAAGMPQRWYEPPLLTFNPGGELGLHCEDCGKPIREGDHFPLDLLRPDPSSSRWLWDSTKQRHVFRPRNARPGGRRFRMVDLCRYCSAEALRRRAQPGVTVDGQGRRKLRYNKVKENGTVRHMRPSERLAPRRGGRPRLLDEPKLRALHAAYGTGLSIGDLVAQLMDAGHPGTQQGLYQSMLYGWRRLELPLRERGEAIKLAHRVRGRLGRAAPALRRCSGLRSRGKPCGQWARVGCGTCIWHADQEEVAA